MVTAPARRELVRHLVDKGLSERRSLAVVRMSASAYRYAPRPDRNVELRARILALAQRHRRYGVGMIHLKLRQAGLLVNYKRVERLYQEAKLQVRRRKRKKVLPGERQPLIRPLAANQVWSMDFVFDRTAEGRVIKCLTIVVSVRPTHLPNSSIKDDGVRVFLSGRDSPYRRDFHAPTKLLPQTVQGPGCSGVPATRCDRLQRCHQPRHQRQRHSQVATALPKPAVSSVAGVRSSEGYAQTAN